MVRHLTLLATLFPGIAKAGFPAYDPGNGINLVTDDGRFAMRIKARFQFLETIQAIDGGPVQQGFNIRRDRVDFSGHVLAKWSQWRIHLAFSDPDLGQSTEGPKNTPLLDVYWRYKADESITFRIGQFKTPLTRSFLNSSSRMVFGDRSILDDQYRMDRDRGAQVRIGNARKDARALVYVGAFQGHGRAAGLVNTFAPLVVGRIELMPLGAFNYHQEGTVDRQQPLRIGTGTGIARHWNAERDRGVKGSAPTDGGTTDMLVWTADLGLRYKLLSIDGATSGRWATRSDDSAIVDLTRNGIGWEVDAGLLLPKVPVAVHGRYAAIQPFGDSSQPRMREAGGSAIWFIHKHPYNLTADVFRLQTGDEASWRSRIMLEISL